MLTANARLDSISAQTGISKSCLLSAACTSVAVSVAIVPQQSSTPHGAVTLAPLKPEEMAAVRALFSTANMQNKMNDAWSKTLSTGLEHGFFVQMHRDGNKYIFRFPGLFTGNSGDMGWKFSYVANHLSAFGLPTTPIREIIKRQVLRRRRIIISIRTLAQ